MDAAYATPPSESAAPTLEVPSNTVPPTAAVVSTADATPVESTAVSAVMSPPPTHSQQQVTEAQNELIESFIESFRYIQSSLSEEASIGTQIQFLESHGYITGLPEVVKELRLLKGTIPAMEEESESLRDLVSSVFTLISKMKQCLSHSLRNPVITFIDFQVGDIALFMPLSTENRKVWIAFNSNSPYHFLAEVSNSGYYWILLIVALLCRLQWTVSWNVVVTRKIANSFWLVSFSLKPTLPQLSMPPFLFHQVLCSTFVTVNRSKHWHPRLEEPTVPLPRKLSRLRQVQRLQQG